METNDYKLVFAAGDKVNTMSIRSLFPDFKVKEYIDEDRFVDKDFNYISGKILYVNASSDTIACVARMYDLKKESNTIYSNIIYMSKVFLD